MTTNLLWLMLTGPLALMLAGWRAGRSRPDTDRGAADRALQGGAVALVVAVGACVALGLAGPMSTPTLGAGGAGFSLVLDRLSVVALLLVAFIGCVVLHFGRNYLEGDPHRGVFLRRLCLALASVLLLVTAGNLLQLLLAWLGTSLALHGLLLHFPSRQGALLAARKKFVASRLGEGCLALALWLLWREWGTLDVQAVASLARQSLAAGAVSPSLHIVGFLLVAAAALKCAQFPLHGWLLEVMETPTPVSALLHAGIINAGGFLLLRLADVIWLTPAALQLLVVVGAVSAFTGSLVMLAQTSVKTSLAWSTVGQMGFMLMQCGLGAFSSALLHIVAHSLYKAHAFLASGSVIEDRRLLPPLRGVPRISDVLLSATLAAVLVTVGAYLLEIDPVQRGGTLLLGFLFVLGLLPLVWHREAGTSRGRWMVHGAVVAALLTAAYYGLQAMVAAAMAGQLPAARPLHGAVDATLVVSVALAGVATLGLAAWLAWGRAGATHSALHAALASGLYVNTLLNRGVLRLWPRVGEARSLQALTSDPQYAASASALVCRPRATSTALLPTVDVVPIDDFTLRQTVQRLCTQVAPLWPLQDFVTVNPFLGLRDRPFEEAASHLQRVVGARLVMPRRFYLDAIDAGRIAAPHLAAALERWPAAAPPPRDVPALIEAARRTHSDAAPTRGAVRTVAQVLDGLAEGNRQVSRTAFMIDEISRWCAAYFDDGQALLRAPQRGERPWPAFLSTARHDRNAEIMGIAGFRALIRDQPPEPLAAIGAVLRELRIPPVAVPAYLERALHDIRGWAAYARHLRWHQPDQADLVIDLLAIRLVWGLALFRQRTDARFLDAWQAALDAATRQSDPVPDPALAIDLTLHEAWERARREDLRQNLRQAADAQPASPAVIHAAFCIDVRSQSLRRAVERADPGIQTLGIAGFFGMPFRYRALGSEHAYSQSPVLVSPVQVVAEAAPGTSPAAARRARYLQSAAAWRVFKLAPLSAFTQVEAAGLMYAVKLAGQLLGLSRPVPDPRVRGVSRALRNELAPDLDADGMQSPWPLDARVDAAESLLRGLSLTRDFAPLVVLVGHASRNVNNPHAAGLDCGACGGHSGEPNAKVAALTLNDARVRAALAARGIRIPASTLFIAGLHETTTDTVRLFECDAATSGANATLVQRAQAAFDAAHDAAQAQRVALPGTAEQRACDWSQVRPEWGLAGNQGLVIAPRARTRHTEWRGRLFLHEYDEQADADGRVLEAIMTAPLVVASWINLQYYASVVDEGAWGAGNKTLHNVVAGLGVLEGNGGDLRTGLPVQSLRDGGGLRHEPVRLSVFIAAPRDRIDRILARHVAVRELVDNGWIHLFALGDARTIWRRERGGGWSAESDAAA